MLVFNVGFGKVKIKSPASFRTAWFDKSSSCAFKSAVAERRVEAFRASELEFRSIAVDKLVLCCSGGVGGTNGDCGIGLTKGSVIGCKLLGGVPSSPPKLELTLTLISSLKSLSAPAAKIADSSRSRSSSESRAVRERFLSESVTGDIEEDRPL